MMVKEKFACPKCDERRIDKLAWIDDDVVRCACGTEYHPLTREVILEAEVKSQNEIEQEHTGQHAVFVHITERDDIDNFALRS